MHSGTFRPRGAQVCMGGAARASLSVSRPHPGETRPRPHAVTRGVGKEWELSLSPPPPSTTHTEGHGDKDGDTAAASVWGCEKSSTKKGATGRGVLGGAARGVGALPQCPHHGTCPQSCHGSGAAPRWQLLGKEEEEEEEEGKNPGGGEEAAQSPRAGGCSLGAGDNLVPPRHRVPKS